MSHEPVTKEAAKSLTYGRYANKYNSDQCAGSVRTDWTSRQCTRKPGHGPDGLYCKQHGAKFAEATETWWRVDRYGDPCPVDVVSHTDHQLTLAGGRKINVHASYSTYYPTETAAWHGIVTRHKAELRTARRSVELTRERLAEAESRLAELASD